MRHARSIAFVSLVALTASLVACSDDDSASDATTASTAGATAAPATPTTAPPSTSTATTIAAPPTTSAETTLAPTTSVASTTAAPTTTAAAPDPLRVLVSNDDGYAAEGIDAVVEYLAQRGDMDVTASAPLEDQSGTGDQTTPGRLTAERVTTASGHPAVAVDGFPADSVRRAMRRSGDTPFDLVVTGSNAGQNHTAMIIPISGTVGAAATAARAGIPAIAVSQGVPHEGQPFDFEASVEALDSYLDGAIDGYRDGSAPLLVNINVPTCPEGVDQFELLEAPPAADWGDRQPFAAAQCRGPLRRPPLDDLDAFNHGHPSLSALDPATLAGIDYKGDLPGGD